MFSAALFSEVTGPNSLFFHPLYFPSNYPIFAHLRSKMQIEEFPRNDEKITSMGKACLERDHRRCCEEASERRIHWFWTYSSSTETYAECNDFFEQKGRSLSDVFSETQNILQWEILFHLRSLPSRSIYLSFRNSISKTRIFPSHACFSRESLECAYRHTLFNRNFSDLSSVKKKKPELVQRKRNPSNIAAR